MLIIICGISGSGKTTVGQELKRHLINSVFIDADDYHSVENKTKMSSGIPLTDLDRMPWLHLLKNTVAGLLNEYKYVILACSCLKRSYRDVFRDIEASVLFLLLDIDVESVMTRLANRCNHFFHPALLQSQIDTLELPIPTALATTTTNDSIDKNTDADQEEKDTETDEQETAETDADQETKAKEEKDLIIIQKNHSLSDIINIIQEKQS
jgi:gluconokinase